jgi:hypothetical protein
VPGGSKGAFGIARYILPLLLAILIGCTTLEAVQRDLTIQRSLGARVAHAARPVHEGIGEYDQAGEEQRERAARGLDSVRIIRSWKIPTESGSTGLFWDVYNAGSRLVTGLVVDLYYLDGEQREATDHTCQVGVVIPAGRVARVSCYKLVADPARVVPLIVDVHWR